MIKILFSKLMRKIQIPSIRTSRIDKTSKIASQSNIVNTKLGKYSYIGNNCTVVNSEIGNFSSIADHCIIGGASHPLDWVSSSPVFHSGHNIMNKNFSNHTYSSTKRTYIGSDVWLGNNCLIKSGVTINDGSIVGMGAVVTKDIPPFEVWAGNPARKIRDRFPSNIKTKLIETKWWNYPDDLITKHAKHFNDVKKFLEILEGEKI